MNVSYTVTGSESAGTQILVVVNGKSHTITEAHPNFEEIRDRLLGREFEGLDRLIDVQGKILSELSENVTISGNTLYYKGEPLYDSLANTVVEFYRTGRSFVNLVNFMERLFENPSRHSRTQLFEFLDRHEFAITDEGYFLAYKGVDRDLCSITWGSAYVNGELVVGKIPNNPGNLIQMDRRDVMDDPTVACSHGLHAGTWEYASGFGPVVVEVMVNPKHVASVPNDCNFQKIRTEEYRVLRQVATPVNPGDRYDIIDEFRAWLRDLAENYTRKGKVAASFYELSESFFREEEEEGNDHTDSEVDALASFVSELDIDHLASKVYRYHLDELLDVLDGNDDDEDDEAGEEVYGYYEDDDDDDDDDDDGREEIEEHYYEW